MKIQHMVFHDRVAHEVRSTDTREAIATIGKRYKRVE